jgi:hypothetical protein
MIDTLMADHGLTLKQAMLFPIEGYFALIPAILARRGIEPPGPTPAAQAGLAAREKCYAFLRRHFHILPPGEPGPENVLLRWLATRAPLPDARS